MAVASSTSGSLVSDERKRRKALLATNAQRANSDADNVLPMRIAVVVFSTMGTKRLTSNKRLS